MSEAGDAAIVVGVDGSESAAEAVRWAAREALLGGLGGPPGLPRKPLLGSPGGFSWTAQEASSGQPGSPSWAAQEASLRARITESEQN